MSVSVIAGRKAGRLRRSKQSAGTKQNIALRLIHGYSNPSPLRGDELPRLDVGPFLTCGNCGRLLDAERLERRGAYCCDHALAPSLHQIGLSKEIINAARRERCGAALADEGEDL